MDMTIYILFLAIPLLSHLILVNINLGLSIIALYLRLIGYPLKYVKALMKVLIAGEFVSGTLGTVLTVILAGIWTPLMNIAASSLYIPLLISLIGIAIRLPSIAGFWYTMDDRMLSNVLGSLMVLGGLLIPLGFRYIFAFINYPSGLLSLEPLKVDPIKTMYNPILPPLYLHTVLGAIIVGIAIASLLIFSMDGDGEVPRRLYRWMTLTISIQVIAGIWLYLELDKHAKYISMKLLNLSNIGIENVAFISMFISILVLAITSVIYYRGGGGIYLKTGFILSILSILSGEIAYDYSRFPYFVVTGESGINAEVFLNKAVAYGLGELAYPFIILMTIAFVAIYLIYLVVVKMLT